MQKSSGFPANHQRNLEVDFWILVFKCNDARETLASLKRFPRYRDLKLRQERKGIRGEDHSEAEVSWMPRPSQNNDYPHVGGSTRAFRLGAE